MITLIHDCVVDVSQNNYTLMVDKHKRNKKGKAIYETIGYYSNLEGAIHGAKDYYIRKQLEAGTYTLKEAVKEIKRVTREFLDLLKGIQNEI